QSSGRSRAIGSLCSLEGSPPERRRTCRTRRKTLLECFSTFLHQRRHSFRVDSDCCCAAWFPCGPTVHIAPLETRWNERSRTGARTFLEVMRRTEGEPRAAT